MQVNSGGTGLQSEINVTPLVDVVLVLLIIFMVVVPMLMQGYDADIPRLAAATDPAQVQESQVILSIDAAACPIVDPPAGEGLPVNCRVKLNDREIPAAQLPASLAELLGGRPPERRVMFLAAADQLNYEGVLRVVDLAKSGVDGLVIEVITAD
jgi:biopolymer transport protein TolR